MSRGDFASEVRPLLDELDDDPDRDPVSAAEATTTFPIDLDLDQLEGQLLPLEDLGEFVDRDVISNRELDSGDVDAAEDAFPLGGIDVLAFYKSFRHVDRRPFPGHWGAFLFDVGIDALTRKLAAVGLGSSVGEVRQLAADVLLMHERYHFWIDAWTLNQEVLPLGSWKKRYVYYRSEARKTALTDADIEESLANHYVFTRLRGRKLSDGKVVRSALRRVLEMSPVPYSNFEFDADKRIEMESYLAVGAANGVLPVVAAVAGRLQPWGMMGGCLQQPNPMHPAVGSHRCPAHLVSRVRYSSLFAPFRGPKLDEFKSFIVKYLDGEELSRTDHAYYRIDNGEKVKIPNAHIKETMPHELKGTLRKAGMTPKEFVQERIRTDFWKKQCPRSPFKPPLEGR